MLLVCIILCIWMIFIITYTTFSVVLDKQQWLDDKENHFETDHTWNVLLWVEFSKSFFHFLYCITLFTMHIVIFKKLLIVMKKRLHYFYQRTKSKIHVLFGSGIVFFWGQTTFSIFDILNKADAFVGWRLGDQLSISLRIFLLILYIFLVVSAFLYINLITKHIDFVLYIRAWMIGYQVENKFEKISYLITRSCIYKEHEESYDDETEDIIYPS